MMYYYRRKANPVKWIIILLIISIVAVLGYWFYDNYFSKIDFSRPEPEPEIEDTIIKEPEEILFNIADLQGEVLVEIENSAMQNAQKSMVLKQGDNIKTENNSQAILELGNIIVRLNQNSEIYFEKLTDQEIILTQLSGRSYHNLLDNNINYQVKSLNSIVTVLSAKFEVITNTEQKFLAVLTFAGQSNITINDEQGRLIAYRIDPGEKALVDAQADKNNMIKIENFSTQTLLREKWYQWNFDLDERGENIITDTEEEEEPDFSVTEESLELATEKKETGIFLSWSVYHDNDFASYKIVRSAQNQDVKYPDDTVIKSSTSKGLNSYLDKEIEPGQQYYYRVCVVKMDDKVVCGNISQIIAEEEEEEITDTEPPLSPNLTTSISEAGVNLNWTANTEEDFKEYKVLKSLTNFLPAYPDEIIAVRLKGSTNYLDNEVNITSVGRYYYRVCSLDLNSNYSCSNVRIIENGQVK